MNKVLYVLIVAVFGLTLFSCGKAKNLQGQEDSSNVYRKPLDGSKTPAVSFYLKSQRYECDDLSDCQESVVKIVSFDDKGVTSCAGALVASDIVLAGSSCFSRKSQISGASCKGSTFIIFPKTKNKAQEILGCDRVNEADNNGETDIALWRKDLIEFKLPSAVTTREPLKINDKGVKDQEELDFWTYKTQDKNKSFQYRSHCKRVGANYLNPLYGSEYAPMLTFTGCTMSEVGGVFSLGTDEVSAIASRLAPDYLVEMARERKAERVVFQPALMATNLSCFGVSDNKEKFDQPKDCLKRLNQKEVDKARFSLIANDHKKLSKDELARLADYMPAKSDDLLSFNFAFSASNSHKSRWELTVKGEFCLKEGWKENLTPTRFRKCKILPRKNRAIYDLDLSLPHVAIETYLDQDYQPKSQLINLANKSYNFGFMPRKISCGDDTALWVNYLTDKLEEVELYVPKLKECRELLR